MKQKKSFVWLVAVFFVLSMTHVVWGQAKTVNATITKVEDGTIIFKTEAGEEVKSKISSKRTKIMVGDKAGGDSDLKEGSKITITYVFDGDRNEPSLIKVTK
ncbi:MAG: hypothetical protein QME90_12440 [Thermodesulfobacteriota bacterium]|nr:hypothetical protein [Thermodesulfobacteriota bacterium]